MNNSLAPTYEKSIGGLWILWYSISNSYSVIDANFKFLIDSYLDVTSKAEFRALILDEDKNANYSEIENTISSYLSNCNIPTTHAEVDLTSFDSSHRNLSRYYSINGKVIQVNYDSELVLKTVHPSIAHCSISTYKSVDTTFDIYLKNDSLFLFKDESLITSAPKLEYHKIQGKFIMHILCTIHDKPESDWIGTFHGSTITDGNSSILIVGASGKGKSTLCALLTANGFNLLADDVSPMLSKNKNIYFNPGAISIKKGAFKILEPIINSFKDLPPINFNKSKGTLKYLPCAIPEKLHYACHAVILVNYRDKSDTIIEQVSVKKMLETLIPDSWLSPNPYHAKQFIDWLGRIKIYELTYSDIKEVANEISILFKSLNN